MPITPHNPPMYILCSRVIKNMIDIGGGGGGGGGDNGEGDRFITLQKLTILI